MTVAIQNQRRTVPADAAQSAPRVGLAHPVNLSSINEGQIVDTNTTDNGRTNRERAGCQHSQAS